MASHSSVDFNALYQSSLKLTTTIDAYGIPRLEKGLDQLDNASRTFAQQQKLSHQQGPSMRSRSRSTSKLGISTTADRDTSTIYQASTSSTSRLGIRTT